MNNPDLVSIPENYHELPSHIEGISVFAPKPLETPESVPQTYKCPNCGANTRFDVATAGVTCEHCGYIAPTRERTVGRAADQHEFTLETLSLAKQGWGINRNHLHCESCGAGLSIPEDAITSSCPFCASNKVNISRAPADILRPKFLIPFKILPKKNQALAREWLGKGWYHPPELASSALINKFHGIYLPFWTFDAQIDAGWKAQIGHERKVRDRKGQTRTEIDWRWESGRAQLTMDDTIHAGTNKVSHLILQKLLPFRFEELTAYSPDFLAGWQAQNYNIPLPEAWQEAKEGMRETARSTCRSQIASSRVRNFSMTANFSHETWRYVLLPVYLAVYKHEDRIFQVMVNGQTGTVAGQKPVAWNKIWLAIAALLIPGLGMVLAGLPLLLVGIVGMGLISLGLALLSIGGLISFSLYKKAVDSERS